MIGHHVPRRGGFMSPRRLGHARLRARGVRRALPPGRRVWWGPRPPQGSRGFWRAARPPEEPTCPQARTARTAREHEALTARNMMSNHTCSDRPLPIWKTSIVVTAWIFTLFEANTKVAACGRQHKRAGAAFGRATSFVVSSVMALNRVNVVAVTTILVFHVGNGQSE